MAAVAIIPARYQSSRFPGKPLAKDTGKYLVQYVYDNVLLAKKIDRVIVATDDERILRAVREFGGEVQMTRSDHVCGTDRIAEVAIDLDDEIIVNVQGDEPEIDPEQIDQLVGLLETDRECEMATLACPFENPADVMSASTTKVVLDQFGRALYFSKGVIPYPRDDGGKVHSAGKWLLHLGIYAYRRDFLLRYSSMPPTPLEMVEKLEQLRALENGVRIAVGIVDRAGIGVDTPEEYAAFVERVRAKESPQGQED
ncbi:MAG: 3-deoxy-manno-octulosonate cytidylyltransferase [Phycisphaerae bacterium]|nr:3-deoxy-manno-octulosonate cytidylyltransferase [Phycisphaerae bacterium]